MSNIAPAMDVTAPPSNIVSIMENIPAPPMLKLPEISFSAPQSRVVTPPPMKARRSFSQPTSPVAKKSPIAKKKSTKPLLTKAISPTRGHRYHATFASYNPRAEETGLQCPVHSYVGVEQEMSMLPKTGVGGVPFGETRRDVLAPTRANCPVHVYAAAKSSLSEMGSASFAKYVGRKADLDACAVHAYATPTSSLRSQPATFAKHVAPRESTSGPAVHAYAAPTSTLKKAGAAAFSTERLRRDAYQGTERALAPVTAYAESFSSLRKVGGATFGSSARSGFPSLTRTGLACVAPAPPSGTPSRPARPVARTLKPLPKLLAPLSEESKDVDGADSPREIEAVLEVLQGPEAVVC